MDFEKKLQEQLDKLPYKKHIDDGQYNDGQLDGFEAGARWAFALFNVVGKSEQLFCGSCNKYDSCKDLCPPTMPTCKIYGAK